LATSGNCLLGGSDEWQTGNQRQNGPEGGKAPRMISHSARHSILNRLSEKQGSIGDMALAPISGQARKTEDDRCGRP